MNACSVDGLAKKIFSQYEAYYGDIIKRSWQRFFTVYN